VPQLTGDPARSVALVTLGCARNDVDSEELAGRLAADGWALVPDPADAEIALVNTCGFIEAAKKDSIDTVLAAADLKGSGRTRAVVAVGCLAQRYGAELAEALPEADAVLGFDDYADISGRLERILAGEPHVSHTPGDRRRLLPMAPTQRPAAHAAAHPLPAAPVDHTTDLPPGVAPASGPRTMRRRLDHSPVAPLKLASGCDRRCSFCAIPSFRGSFLSRPPADVLAEAHWLAQRGVREIVLVSENSTSYGKDLPGGTRALTRLLPRLGQVPGIDRVRLSYLQPAEMRPDLIAVLAGTPGIAPYFDLSFQHASPAVLRRMRRFGSRPDFLDLCARIRALAPEAGIRSNVIVGFPGETEQDLAELEAFLNEARLDAVGVFGYSDEDGTEAADYADKVHPDEVRSRVTRVSALVDELIAQRAEDRVGTEVDVLVEAVEDEDFECTGRAAHQAPEVDGECVLERGSGLAVGDLVRAVVIDTEGADLVVSPRELLPRSGLRPAAAVVEVGG